MTGDGPQLWAGIEAPLPAIASVGLMAFDPIYAQEVHVNRAAEILHIVAGSVTVHMPGGPVRGGPGDTILIPSGSSHRDEFDLEEGLEVFYCSFRWAAEADYFRAVPPQALERLSPACRTQLAALADQLRADLAQGRDIDQLVARSRVLTALMLIFRDVGPADPEGPPSAPYGEVRRHELMSRARQYMQQHYARPVSLDEIAEALHVSGYYLSHVFSAESDFTLFSYLTTVRMERARALLLAGGMNVSEIARAVGYRSPNYFSKVFRRHFGCSPREFVASRRPGKAGS
jgi:AraC-like DNA-binding protein